MVLRLKTRESRSLPGLLKARTNTRSSARSHKPSTQDLENHLLFKLRLSRNNRAALKRPFCFARISRKNAILLTQNAGKSGDFAHAKRWQEWRFCSRKTLDIRPKPNADATILTDCAGNAGWSSPVARQAHNLKAAGSNPAPATKIPRNTRPLCPHAQGFSCFWA